MISSLSKLPKLQTKKYQSNIARIYTCINLTYTCCKRIVYSRWTIRWPRWTACETHNCSNSYSRKEISFNSLLSYWRQNM